MKNNDVDSYDWESLGVGQTVRIHCSSPTCDHKLDSLTITRTPEGCIFNCFRCSVSGGRRLFSTPTQASNKLKNWANHKVNTVIQKDPDTKFILPSDYCNLARYHIQGNAHEVPSYIWSYLYQFDLQYTEFIDYNIGYSKQLDGIIFPIYKDHVELDHVELIAYLIRYVNKNIKYKLITKDTIYNYNNINNININNKRIIYKLNNINNGILILTEDIISCIKIHLAYRKYSHTHMYVPNIWALLTTSVPDYNELKKYSHIFLWLDYDAKVKALRTIMNMRAHGINSSCIITPKDPKWYTKEGIYEQVQSRIDALKTN